MGKKKNSKNNPEISTDEAEIVVTEITEIREPSDIEEKSEPQDFGPTAYGNENMGSDGRVTNVDEIESAIEAIIFASPKALPQARLKQILTSNQYDTSGLKDLLASLQARYEERPFQLVKVAGGYQFRTHPRHAQLLGKLLEDKPARLSPSALEVLAIVAYKQPITRSEIDAIRGIDSGHLLKGLLEKDIVRTEGHSESPGRPLLYGTTPYFLEVFTLNSLDDLPSIEEFERELQEAAGVNGEENNAEDPLLLAADPDFFDRLSPLAANPDRGAFDEPAEDIEERPDFGISEHLTEDLAMELDQVEGSEVDSATPAPIEAGA